MPKAATKAVTTRTRAPSAKKKAQEPTASADTSATQVQAGGVSDGAVDESQWRQSKVWFKAKIPKSIATKKYRVKDFTGLPFEQDEKDISGRNGQQKIVPMFLYNERDVERKAWRDHGGPEGFDAYLAKLRERHIKKHGNANTFEQPDSYQDPGGGVYIVQPKKTDVPYDRHVGSSAPLLRAKQGMLEWLWSAFNEALDWHNAINYESCQLPFESPRSREGPMGLAAKVARTYPSRPTQPLPSSASVDALRAVLADAPSAPDGKRGVTDIPGIVWDEDEDGDGSYEWSDGFLERLFSALVSVLQAHHDGWETVRWEVYDKYRECFKQSISYHYSKNHGEWTDAAAHWLDGRYTTEGSFFDWSSRGQCPSGKQYNAMLPLLHPGGSPQVGHVY